MFFVGMALDHSTTFPDHPCGKAHLSEKNYTVCFAVFSVLMSCAFLAALQVRLCALLVKQLPNISSISTLLDPPVTHFPFVFQQHIKKKKTVLVFTTLILTRSVSFLYVRFFLQTILDHPIVIKFSIQAQVR